MHKYVGNQEGVKHYSDKFLLCYGSILPNPGSLKNQEHLAWVYIGAKQNAPSEDGALPSKAKTRRL